MTRSAILALACTLLAGCADFPEVARMEPEAGPPPPLLPIDDLLAQAGLSRTDPAP